MVRQHDRSQPEKRLPDLLPIVVEERAALPVALKTARRFQFRRVVVAAAMLAAMWWILNPDDPLSWVIGGPVVVMATAAALLLPASGTQHISVSGLVRFATYFIIQTVLGAVDVAFRALDPRGNVRPAFMTWETDLPEGAPRWLFAMTITLLPGTLTAEMKGPSLTLHLLDQDLAPDLSRLEIRIRDLFALTTLETTP